MKRALSTVLPAAVLTLGAVGCDTGGYDGRGTPVIDQPDDDGFDIDHGKRKTKRPGYTARPRAPKAPGVRKPPSFRKK